MPVDNPKSLCLISNGIKKIICVQDIQQKTSDFVMLLLYNMINAILGTQYSECICIYFV